MMSLFISNKPLNICEAFNFSILLHTQLLYIADTLYSVNKLKKKKKKKSLKYSESDQRATGSPVDSHGDWHNPHLTLKHPPYPTSTHPPSGSGLREAPLRLQEKSHL